MIVEDDEDFRTVLSWTLEDEGCRIAPACNGREALELLARDDLPDLVLLDLNMPGMDGWQLRHELERRLPDVELPIAVMTAARAQSAEALRVVEVLQKPFPLERLVALVDRYCTT